MLELVVPVLLKNIIVIVTRFAKTWHIHASLNLQYKPLRISKNSFSLVKKGFSGKNVYIACSRGVQNLWCSRLKDMRIMILCLCHVEMIVWNAFFFTDLSCMYVEKKSDARQNLSSNGCLYSQCTWWCKLQLCVTFHS